MGFRIAQCGLDNCRRGIIVGGCGVYPVPRRAVENGIVVSRRVVIADCLRAGLLSVYVPPLGVILAVGAVNIVRHPACHIVVGYIEQSVYVLRRADNIHQLTGKKVVDVAIDAFTAHHRIVDAGNLTLHKTAKIRAGQYLVHNVLGCARSYADRYVIEIFCVSFQVFFCEMVRSLGEHLLHIIPVDDVVLRKLKKFSYLWIELKEVDVAESQSAVCHNRLELHTKGFCLIANLHQIAPPIEGVVRLLQHQPGDHHNLRNDFGGHHTVDAFVIVILCRTAPDTEVGKSLAVEKLGREDGGCGNLGRSVFLQNLLYLLIIISLGACLHTVCRSHRRHGLGINIEICILGRS